MPPLNGASGVRRTIFEAEHEAFRDSVARFLQKEAAPKVECWREQGSVDRETWLAAGYRAR